MRKLLLFLMASVIAIAAKGSDNNALRIIPVSGEPVTIMFDDEPEVSFSGENVIVKMLTEPEQLTFEFSDIDNIMFVEAESSGIDTGSTAGNNGITIAYSGTDIIFGNIPANSDLKIFAVDGRLTFATTASGEYTLDTSALTGGVYIVAVGTTVIKIRK